MVLATFEPTGEYVRAIHDAWPSALVLNGRRDLAAQIERFASSDALLLFDPAVYPLNGLGAEQLAQLTSGDRGIARHLLAVDGALDRAKEYVHEDGDGRVRRIQRYYDPIIWPFVSGIVCSLVPLAGLLTLQNAPLLSLPDLRRALSAHGVPGHDIPFASPAFDLREEDGVLALIEHTVEHARLGSPPHRREGPAQWLDTSPAGARTHVAPSARVVGPVILQEDVRIEEDATVIGPALLAAGSRVGRGATVVQCLVMPGIHVAAGAVWRHRVVLPGPPASSDELPLRPHASRHALTAAPLPTAVKPRYRAAKTAFDMLVAAVLLVALAPLLVIVALLVRLTSSGPAFYGDLREGLDGRPFRCWKFRTMTVGADAAQHELLPDQQLDGPQFKMRSDPRTTSIGRWLRRMNLDEVPQLLNVLLRQMSLVGPRPSPFRENQVCIPWRRGRLSVRPGITGLWQVCRRDREHGDFHQWIEYDLLYVRHMSFAVDLKILIATVLTLGGKHAVAASRIIPASPTPAAPRTEANVPLGRRAAVRRRVGRGVASALAVCVAASPVRAAAQLPSVLGDETARGWSLSARIDEVWDSNVRFTPRDGTADQTLRAGMEAVRLWWTPRTNLAITAGGGMVRFREVTEFDQSTYNVTVRAGREFTRRLSGTWNVHLRSDLTNRSITSVGEGPLLAGIVTGRTQSSGGGVSYRLTPRTTAQFATSYQHASFDTPLLIGGWIATGSAQLSRRYSRAAALVVGYEFRQSEAFRQNLGAHQLTGSWDYRLGEHLSARLTGGAASTLWSDRRSSSALPTPASPAGIARSRAAHNLSGVGSGALRITRPTFQLGAQYQHSVGQVFGRELPTPYVTDAVGLDALRTLPGRLRLGAGVRYAWSTEQSTSRQAVRSMDGTLDATYTLRSGVTVSAGAVLRQRVDQVTRASTAGRIGVGYALSRLAGHTVPQTQGTP